jgi:phosphoesterase RecJ-like protein
MVMMKSDQTIEDLGHHLTHSAGVLVLTHQDPDFDAIGSSLAWCLQLQKLDVPFYFYVADTVYAQFQFLPYIHLIRQDMPKLSSFDTVLALDCSNLDRIRKWDQLEVGDESSLAIINIDHHQDNRRFGNFNVVEMVSSVGELTCHMFQQLGWSISADQATCLYAAMMYDTGSFLNSNVKPETFRVAATLLEAGADTEKVIQNMYENLTSEDYEALKIMLEHLVVEGGIAYSILPPEIPNTSLKLIHYIRQLSGIEVALLFRSQENDTVQISLRSKSDFSVSKFSALFGGGGHHRASGIMMAGSLAQVSREVISKLKKSILDPQFRVS